MSLINKLVLFGIVLLLLSGGFLVLKNKIIANELANYAYFSFASAIGIQMWKLAKQKNDDTAKTGD